MPPRALTPEQQQVLDALLAEGRRIRDPRVRRVFERAAVQTGLVESGLRNLPGGDADSAGWRQERASLYPDPTNLGASARRFRQEFLQHYDPGERSWDVAAQVQRPAAQYRGRYRDVAGQAAAILKAAGGSGAVASGASSAPSSALSAPLDFGSSADASALISLLAQDRRGAPAPSMPLPTPAATAGPVLPESYRALSAGQAPRARQGVGALLAAVQTPGGRVPTLGGAVSDAGGPLAPSERSGGGQSQIALPRSGKNPWGVVEQAGRSGRYLQQTYGVKEIGGYRANDPYPDHPSRKALDLMVYDDAEKGNAIAQDLIANHKAHGVRYIIWNQRIWHPGKGWKKMADRGSPTQNHEDHVHVLYR